MSFKDVEITKKKVLGFYKGSESAKAAALARDLSVSTQVVQAWGPVIPRWWAIIIVNLIHRDKFGLPPIGE